MSQTTIQESSAIRKGSVRVLIGDDFNSLVDIGALRKPITKSMAEIQSVEFDNVDPLRKYVKGKRYQITFDLAEVNLTNLAVLDSGLIDVTPNAGSLVAGATQLIVSGSWNFKHFIKIANQNGDNTLVTVNSVTGATDGLLVADSDYYVTQNEAGESGIVLVEGGSGGITTENQNVTVDYDYTPNASKTVTFNDAGEKNLKCMRIVNTDENGKVLRIDIENGTNFAPVSMTFASDIQDDVATVPIDFQGDVVSIYDEQNI